jgi:energy-coupling factor transporter ATP-binding protein EcfA2
LLADLNRQGITIIVATHDLELARDYAHRTVRMRYGRLIGEGSNVSEAETER